MNSVHVVALATALLTVLFIALSLNVIRLRHKHNQAYLPNQPELVRAHRAQANFSEYVPLALLLLWAVLLCKGPLWFCSLITVILFVGRLCHARGLLHGEALEPPSFKLRKYGMILTFFALALASVYILYFSLKIIYISLV